MFATITSLNKSKKYGWEIATEAYKGHAIKALAVVHRLGGDALVDKLSGFNSNNLRRDIADFMTDLADIEIDKLPKEAQEGLIKVIKEMSHKLDNKAKGAVHHINLISDYQKKGIDIVKIEMRETVKIGDKELRDRIYDIYANIDGVLTKVEAKSWIASGIPANTKAYLLGKKIKHADGTIEYTGEGAQLLMDLMSYAQNGFSGYKWMFHKDMKDNPVFKAEVFKNLKDNTEVRNKLMGYLKKDEYALNVWIKELKLNFDNFYGVI